MSHRSRLLAAAASSCALFACASPVTVMAAPVDEPTAAAVQADGPYAIAQVKVSAGATPGFGAATVSYPTNAPGKVGAVAVSPGFTAPGSSVGWYGRALATHGFAVITFDTNSVWDQPSARATQLLRAVDYLAGASAAAGVVDPSRTAVMGHSMGGGGAIEATKRRPALKAAVGLTPWNLDSTAPEDRTPTLVVGAQNDTVAPTGWFANPLYRGINSTTPKALATLAGVGHMAPTSRNPAIQGTVVAWLKRFVDGDTRYAALLCDDDTAAPAGSLSGYQSNCARW